MLQVGYCLTTWLITYITRLLACLVVESENALFFFFKIKRLHIVLATRSTLKCDLAPLDKRSRKHSPTSTSRKRLKETRCDPKRVLCLWSKPTYGFDCNLSFLFHFSFFLVLSIPFFVSSYPLEFPELHL